MNPLRREVVVQGVPVLHVGQQWCGQMVHCDCWGPWQAGRVHQKVAGNLLAQGTEGRQLLDQGGLKKESLGLFFSLYRLTKRRRAIESLCSEGIS